MSPILPKRPLHPGVFLRNHFRLPLGYTQQELADALGVRYQVISRLENGKQGVSIDLALRLEAVLGTTAGMWINLQRMHEEAKHREQMAAILEQTTPITPQAKKRRKTKAA